MLEVLARWNRWGNARLESGYLRDVTGRLAPFLRSKETVALIGPRRAGKTTVMFQVMDQLEKQGVPPSAMLHLNLEEPGLTGSLGSGVLDRAYDAYRYNVYPEGRAYVFLDEVQRIPEWERWVRARTESDGIKVFVTGSSSALMSRELGTLVTGRHVDFTVYPLSFGEFLRFRDVRVLERVKLAGSVPGVRKALHEYLTWGGFPEVVLSDSEVRRERLLREYFDDVLFKDVTLRHSVRDAGMLRVMAAALMAQSAGLVSYGRLAARLGASLDLVRAYCSYLEEAYLVGFVPYRTMKAAERLRRPQKVHPLDTGLRNAVCMMPGADRGRVMESAAWAAASRRSPGRVSYWKGRGEVDLVVGSGNRVERLIQVVGEGLDDPGVMARETGALAEGRNRFRRAVATLVYGAGSAPSPCPAGVECIPLWRFLLEE